MIPLVENIELPLLQILAERSPQTWNECTQALSRHFRLSEHEIRMLTPNGKCGAMKYRVGWAKANLKKKGLVKAISRGVYAITDLGVEHIRNISGLHNDTNENIAYA